MAQTLQVGDRKDESETSWHIFEIHLPTIGEVLKYHSG